MTIQLFSDKLRESLEGQLAKQEVRPNDLVGIGHQVNLIREAFHQLKNFTVSYSFIDQVEEIDFFKRIKPEFTSIFLYHRKLLALALFDSFRDAAARQANYRVTLGKLERYALRHQQLYEYWISGSTDLDSQYFIRGWRDHHVIDRDDKFTTRYDVELGKIMAHERLRNHIMLLIDHGHRHSTLHSGLNWTASKSSLIELVYALHAAGVFNNGSADIKVIATSVENIFNTSLGNYYRVFQDIRSRKVNPTAFLDDLKKGLIRKIADSEK